MDRQTVERIRYSPRTQTAPTKRHSPHLLRTELADLLHADRQVDQELHSDSRHREISKHKERIDMDVHLEDPDRQTDGR